MNSRSSYDSETARRVGLEFVRVFGHEGDEFEIGEPYIVFL